MAKPEKTINIGLRLPISWLAVIDELIATKFPHRTRSEWARGVVEHELMRQRDGNSKDARLDRLLANDDEQLRLLREVHRVMVNT